jgi:hypothetical protein
MMKTLLVVIVASAIGLLALLETGGLASAQRRWSDYPNSGYCPPGTCTPLGYWRAANVKFCKPRPNCRWR